MLQNQNAYFLAKIGADTAENEQHFAVNTIVQGLRDQGPPRLPLGLPLHGLDLAVPGRFFFSTGPVGPGRKGLGLGVRDRKIGKISKLFQIFGGLVLGCIKTNFKFCKKICV